MNTTKATNWIYQEAKSISYTAREQAEQRQNNLTKPPGSLGRLEKLVIQLAGLQQTGKPEIQHPTICIFAADHGVVKEGISAFPQEVTTQMLMNFVNGGAAISVLARELGADIHVVNTGTVNELPKDSRVKECSIAKGTHNFCREAAMSMEQLAKALNVGKDIVDVQLDNNTDIFIGGEMGIGNTTSAAALSCALINKPASELVGRGTGLDDKSLENKISVVEQAIQLHKDFIDDPIECLRRLGGFEIAALTGSYIRCAQLGISVLVDGFICSAAALVASTINTSIAPWLIFSHESAEQGHKLILNSLGATPILALDMRLGEGSGAAMALPLLKLACTLHNNMATFAEAGVSSN